MEHSVILQYVQALGFPICSSIALGWALWKIGGQLLQKFFDHVDSMGPKIDRIVQSNEAMVDHMRKWPPNVVEQVTESVIDKIKADLNAAGCRLLPEDSAIISAHRRAKT